MKTTKPQFLIGVPDGPIKHMDASWANEWINIYNNGGIGYQGSRMPTKAEKKDILKRISKLQDLLNERQQKLQDAWYLIQLK